MTREMKSTKKYLFLGDVIDNDDFYNDEGGCRDDRDNNNKTKMKILNNTPSCRIFIQLKSETFCPPHLCGKHDIQGTFCALTISSFQHNHPPPSPFS